MAYGWRQVFIGQREKHEMAREKMWSRIHLIPLLQAEEDRDQVRRYYADLAREKELLGSQSAAYNSDRYVGYISLRPRWWRSWAAVLRMRAWLGRQERGKRRDKEREIRFRDGKELGPRENGR